jgi:hypothetical protein
MKNKTKNQLILGIILATVVAGYAWWYASPRVVTVEVPVPVQVPVQVETAREPEFRGPPIKRYKPGYMQQMGLVVGPNEETLPLYGKEVRGRRDRYHYYTTTPGEQVYPVPVSVDGRECTDDIGCQELYGNETVSVLGKTGSFTAKMYRTDDFF